MFVLLIMRAGHPTAIEKAGTSCVTTVLAPMIVPSPIVTPPRIAAFSPIQTLSPIFIIVFLVNLSIQKVVKELPPILHYLQFQYTDYQSNELENRIYCCILLF